MIEKVTHRGKIHLELELADISEREGRHALGRHVDGGGVVLRDVLREKRRRSAGGAGKEGSTYVLSECGRPAGDHDVVIIVAGTRVAATRGAQPGALQCA